MKIKTTQNVANLKTLEELIRYCGKTFQDILAEFNGRVDLLDNCATELLDLTFTSSGVEVSSKHNLGRAPRGYLVAGASAAIQIYDGQSVNTSEFIFFRANGAARAKVLIF